MRGRDSERREVSKETGKRGTDRVRGDIEDERQREKRWRESGRREGETGQI